MRSVAAMLLAAGYLLTPARFVQAQGSAQDTLPAAVVQRFVDAVNARQIDRMMDVVAAQAVFATLPDNGRPTTGRDSVRANYSRILGRLSPGYTVTVVSRISDGPFVTDLEVFTNGDGTPAGRATWVYYVARGQIQRASALRPPRTITP